MQNEESQSSLEEEKLSTNSGYKELETSSEEEITQFYSELKLFARLFDLRNDSEILQTFKDIIQKKKQLMMNAYIDCQLKKKERQAIGRKQMVASKKEDEKRKKEEKKKEKETKKEENKKKKEKKEQKENKNESIKQADPKPVKRNRIDNQLTSKIKLIKRVMNDLINLEGFYPRI